MGSIRLGDIARVRSGYHFRSSFTPSQKKGVLVLQMGDLDIWGNLSKPLKRASIDRVKDEYILQDGDVLLRCRGDNFRAFLIDGSLVGACLSAPLLRIRAHREGVSPGYLAWYLNQERVRKQLHAGACGTATKMIHINLLEKVMIAVPSTKIQLAIANTVLLAEKEQALIELLREKRNKLVHGQLTSLLNKKSN